MLNQRFVADGILVASLAWLSADLHNEVSNLSPCEAAIVVQPRNRLHKRLLLNPCSPESRLLMDVLDSEGGGRVRSEMFQSCRRPIHLWLHVSYAMIILSRLMGSFGAAFTSKESGDFMLNLRHENSCLRRCMSLTWLFVLPLYALWTLLGSYWLYEVHVQTPKCLPAGIHTYFLITWQALSYIWIIIHFGLGVLAWVLERWVRRVERDLRLVENADVRERWGDVSQIGSYNSLPNPKTVGLTPTEIGSLSSFEVTASLDDSAEDADCAVCLAEMQCGDYCRRLPGCSHAFHRSCIDLWLLRNKDCPLCKASVSPTAEHN